MEGAVERLVHGLKYAPHKYAAATAPHTALYEISRHTVRDNIFYAEFDVIQSGFTQHCPRATDSIDPGIVKTNPVAGFSEVAALALPGTKRGLETLLHQIDRFWRHNRVSTECLVHCPNKVYSTVTFSAGTDKGLVSA